MTIERIIKEQLGDLENLWKKLNEIHQDDSIHFKAHFASQNYEKRMAGLMKNDEDDLLTEVIRDGESLKGYCLSSVREEKGEIESLYIDPECRSSGLGEKLVKNALAWMEEKGCSRFAVSVAAGHERVLPFYEKMGFRLRLLTLEQT